MNTKSKLKPVALAVGAAFATTLAMTPVAQATTTASNPFAMNQLESGFKLAAMGNEGNCGANKAKKDMKDGKSKMKESSCSANKGKMKEASCGANKSKSKSMGM